MCRVITLGLQKAGLEKFSTKVEIRMEIGSTVPLVHRHLAVALVMVQLEHNLLKKPVGTCAGVWVWQGFQKRYPDPYLANLDPLPVRVLLTRGLPYHRMHLDHPAEEAPEVEEERQAVEEEAMAS
jgi:hypothetical protein